MQTIRRSAFTMLELVMVIGIVGILSLVALTRLDRDRTQEAADNILSAVRYTQHLALTDDRHDLNNNRWQRSFWMIRFVSNTHYIVGSDANYGGNIDKNESAVDPANGKLMYTTDTTIDSDESPTIFIGRKYGIDTIDFSNCQQTVGGRNRASHIAFDHMGRPHKGITRSNIDDYSTLLSNDCEITFSGSDISSFTLHIERETGFAYIVGQENI